MERTSCSDTTTQFLPGQLVLNPRSVSMRRVTAPMVPLCFHLHSGLCRGQRSQLLHKTCCVCCCSLVLLLQDEHKEMALHWAHLCTQSARRASHQTLRSCRRSKLYCHRCVVSDVCVGAARENHWVHLIQGLFRNTCGCGGVRRKQYQGSFFSQLPLETRGPFEGRQEVNGRLTSCLWSLCRPAWGGKGSVESVWIEEGQIGLRST